MMRYVLAILAVITLVCAHTAQADDRYTVQVGSFSDSSNAQKALDELASKGYSCDMIEDAGIHKIHCGELESKDEAFKLRNELSSIGHEGLFITKAILPAAAISQGAGIDVAPDMPAFLGDADEDSSVESEESEEMASEEPMEIASAEEVMEGTLEEPMEPASEEMMEGSVEEPMEPASAEEMMEGSVEEPMEPTSAEEMMEGSVEEPMEPVSAELASTTTSTSLADLLSREVELREQQKDEEEVHGTISGEVFERSERLIHPFLHLTAVYTDNVFNVKEIPDQDIEREEDYIYIISPGFWLTLPSTGIKPEEPLMSTGTPGGMRYTDMRTTAGYRYHMHLFYRGDAEEYWDNETEDIVNHTAEAGVSFDSLTGFYVALSDQYVKSHEDRATTVEMSKNVYEGNRANATIVIGQGKSHYLRLEYTIYDLNYKNDEVNYYRERLDQKYGGALYFQIMPKTRLYAGYEHVNINYDEEVLVDSAETSYFAGVQWDITGKTSGTLRGGQSVKQFDEDYNLDDEKSNFAELQLSYTPTSKSLIRLFGSRAWKESTVSTSPFILSQTGKLEYAQRLSEKISSTISATYFKDEYEGEVSMYNEDGEVEVGERTDYLYVGTVALRWDMTRWHSISLGYIYKKRDSNFDILDYYSNMGFLRLSGQL